MCSSKLKFITVQDYKYMFHITNVFIEKGVKNLIQISSGNFLNDFPLQIYNVAGLMYVLSEMVLII